MAGGLYYNYIYHSSYKGHQRELGQRMPHLRVKHSEHDKSFSIHLVKWTWGSLHSYRNGV